jgi:hypothetical protein
MKLPVPTALAAILLVGASAIAQDVATEVDKAAKTTTHEAATVVKGSVHGTKKGGKNNRSYYSARCQENRARSQERSEGGRPRGKEGLDNNVRAVQVICLAAPRSMRASRQILTLLRFLSVSG